MAVGDALLLTSQFAAAGLFLLLAVVLLVVRFNSRVNRAFAIFLLLRGAALALQAFARVPAYEDNAQTLFDVARYFALATPFVLLYFVVLYRAPHGSLAVRAAGIAAILATLVVETMFLLDHCTISCPEQGPGGILTPVAQATALALGLAALAIGLGIPRMSPPARARPALLVAAAFTLLALLEGTQGLSLLLTDGMAALEDVPFWLAAARLILFLGFVTATLSLLVLLRLPVTARVKGLLISAALVVVTTTLYQLYAEDRAEAFPNVLSVTTALFGLWRLLAAAIVAYALVRHRFLDLDLRINWTISRGTVLAILVATFLVVSKVLENELNARLGVLFGGIATGLLMLAIKPLERLGDKVAATIHPRGQSKDLESDQRVSLFQEQAVMVWADGHIGRKERLLLDNLRERLQIPAGLAAQIEHEAALQTDAGKTSAPLSTQS